MMLAALIIAGALVVVASQTWAGQQLGDNGDHKNEVCPDIGSNHLVIVEDGRATPQHTKANLCDRLTIENRGNDVLEMAFGKHDHHTPYDGVTERSLEKGERFSVTLVQAGSFRFHDHITDQAHGDFTVVK